MNLCRTTRSLWQAQSRERLKLTLGRWLYPGPTRTWLSYLHSDELLWRQVRRFPKFVTRIYRPYGLRSLGVRQRVEHMIGHYATLHHLGLRALLEQSLDAPMLLAPLDTKESVPASLQFVSVYHGHREGEAHVLLDWNGHRLYAMSFLLRNQDDACQQQARASPAQGRVAQPHPVRHRPENPVDADVPGFSLSRSVQAHAARSG